MSLQLALYTATRPGLAGVYNRLVRFVDGRGKYSHVELIFSDGVAASSSYMDGGVRVKTIDFDPAKWVVVDLPDWCDAGRARAWFEQHEGAGYDIAGNLHFVFHWWPHSRSKWFCSEAIAAALGLDHPENLGPNGLAQFLTERA